MKKRTRGHSEWSIKHYGMRSRRFVALTDDEYCLVRKFDVYCSFGGYDGDTPIPQPKLSWEIEKWGDDSRYWHFATLDEQEALIKVARKQGIECPTYSYLYARGKTRAWVLAAMREYAQEWIARDRELNAAAQAGTWSAIKCDDIDGCGTRCPLLNEGVNKETLSGNMLIGNGCYVRVFFGGYSGSYPDGRLLPADRVCDISLGYTSLPNMPDAYGNRLEYYREILRRVQAQQREQQRKRAGNVIP